MTEQFKILIGHDAKCSKIKCSPQVVTHIAKNFRGRNENALTNGQS